MTGTSDTAFVTKSNVLRTFDERLFEAKMCIDFLDLFGPDMVLISLIFLISANPRLFGADSGFCSDQNPRTPPAPRGNKVIARGVIVSATNKCRTGLRCSMPNYVGSAERLLVDFCPCTEP